MRFGWVYHHRVRVHNAPEGLPRGKSARVRACAGVISRGCVARARHTRAPVRMRAYMCVRRA